MELVNSVQAQAAMIRDGRSQLIWGWSLREESASWAPRSVQDLEDLGSRASTSSSLSAQGLLQASALWEGAAKCESPTWLNEALGFAVRSFGGVYAVLVTFQRGASPLRIEGALRRVIPSLERILMSWPTTDPHGPAGARRVRLHLV